MVIALALRRKAEFCWVTVRSASRSVTAGYGGVGHRHVTAKSSTVLLCCGDVKPGGGEGLCRVFCAGDALQSEVWVTRWDGVPGQSGVKWRQSCALSGSGKVAFGPAKHWHRTVKEGLVV